MIRKVGWMVVLLAALLIISASVALGAGLVRSTQVALSTSGTAAAAHVAGVSRANLHTGRTAQAGKTNCPNRNNNANNNASSEVAY